MAIGARDLLVLIACGTILLLALTQEGDMHIEGSWFQPVEFHSITNSGATPYLGQLMTTYANGVAPMDNEVVPAPLITDIDGDGTNEVVLVTREPKLKIFKFKKNLNANAQSFNTLYSHKSIDWEQLVLVREIGLLSSLMITSGRQIVGLSSGYIRPYSSTRNRKQVIVVVNESFGIFVFNHRLKLLWTRTVEADLSLRYLAEVAILVDPHPMRRGTGANNDTGVIVVGGRLGLKSEIGKNIHHGLHHDTTTEGSPGPKPLEFPADYAEALAGRILRPGRKKGFMTSDEPRDREEDHSESLGVDPLHFERAKHFSYYAFEGLRGDSRWKHDSSSFLEESHANSILKPQHESVHSGEQDWRVFRRSIMEYALPHMWTGGRAATWFDLAHIEKTRQGHQKQKVKKQRQIKSNFFVRDALNLRPHKDTEHILKPNALIVHLRDGLEILHLYSGRPLCRLTLKQGQVHVDLDGDGVIDHIEAVGGVHMGGSASRMSRNQERDHAPALPKCLAMVQSGVPPNRQLFNASICSTSWADLMRSGTSALRTSGYLGNLAAAGSGASGRASATGFSLEGSVGSTSGDGPGSTAMNFLGQQFQQEQQRQEGLKVAHPIVIQEPRTTGKTAKKRRFHSFFFLNTGLLTSFNHDGSRSWHVPTRAAWLGGSKGSAEDGSLSPAEEAFRPSMVPFTLHADSSQPSDHVLVVGERYASLVSFAGNLRAEVLLARDMVIAEPVIGDFDDDGLNDIVLVTTKGFYGYRVQRRLAGQLFSLLVMGLVILLGAVFAFKVAQSSTMQAVTSYRPTAWVKGRATFTGSLRQMGKSAKAQL